uniref:MARVEL domain-containing protein n=1 Tax=Ascaris lumbricoides TaxID=6252 RepID=A0A9J2PFU5_ASCLU
MCSAKIYRILYIISVFIMFVLTAAALFTPGWRKFNRRSDGTIRFPGSSGLFSFLCASSNDAGGATGGGVDYCKEWFKSSEAWEQAVVICLCVAFAIESVTLVWSIITVVCSPLDTKGASAVLPFLTFLASILVMFAATLYTVKKDTKIGYNIGKAYKQSTIGYSFYLAVNACSVGVIATILGGFAAACRGGG